jgi:hypothetical protein
MTKSEKKPLFINTFRPVVGVFTNHICVSTQTNVAFARVVGGDTNHGAGSKGQKGKG